MKLDIDILVEQIVGANIDITTDFKSWTNVAFALASEYGEEGRKYFHKLAKLSPTYKKGENDKKYDNALKTGKRIKIGTLVYIAKKNDIDISSAYMNDVAEIDNDYIFTPPESVVETFDIKSFVGMDKKWVENAHSFATQSTLYIGLTNLSFLKKKSIIDDIFNEYEVGALADHKTSIFWQIDKNGKVRTGKTIPYLDNIHRDKTRGANWIHSLKKMDGYKFKQCPFGEYLSSIYDKAKMVFLVESEKTALICNILYRNNDNFIWMASGGIQNLNNSALKDLKDKYIKLFADTDAKNEWQTKMNSLLGKGYNIQMIDWQSMVPETIEIGGKDDIADIILKADRNTLVSLHRQLAQISCLC